jgi:hypothetical protein
VVTALLHYLFLSVFCWMLSEGVMLYLMLWVVFSTLSKKWWFFMMLGWCKYSSRPGGGGGVGWGLLIMC